MLLWLGAPYTETNLPTANLLPPQPTQAGQQHPIHGSARRLQAAHPQGHSAGPAELGACSMAEALNTTQSFESKKRLQSVCWGRLLVPFPPRQPPSRQSCKHGSAAAGGVRAAAANTAHPRTRWSALGMLACPCVLPAPATPPPLPQRMAEPLRPPAAPPYPRRGTAARRR